MMGEKDLERVVRKVVKQMYMSECEECPEPEKEKKNIKLEK